MRRSAAAVLVAACTALLGASCGGDSNAASTASSTVAQATTASGTRTPAAAGGTGATLEQLWRAPGEDVAVVPGTSDYQAGRNRVSFLVVDKQSKLVERPTARIWVSRGLKQKPFATGKIGRAHV